MNELLHIVYKEEGETPLECLRRYQSLHPELDGKKGTYAGRLDPMASGVLILLFGEEMKRKNEYLSLDKEYEVEVLLGVSTDTGDTLGLVEECEQVSGVENDQVQQKAHGLIGVFEEPYPQYSSKPVQGQPLFSWARAEGTTVPDLPLHTVTIKNVEVLDVRDVRLNALSDEALMRIAQIKGDFRQDAISARWCTSCDERGDISLVVVTLRIECKSGAYMRVLAEKLARSLGYPGLAWKIKRTKIGQYSITKKS